MENPEFLKKKYDLHNKPEVKSATRRAETITGERVPQKPTEQIQNYLNRFKEIIEREDPEKRERGMRALKKVLYDKFVIKEDEISESYFDAQQRIAREQGHGDVEISGELREQATEVIITDQKSSMDVWTDYLSSKDATYPDWLKYYAFRSMLGMGEYDKEKKSFTKRTKGTVKPFPDLNREALAYVLDSIEEKAKGEDLDVYLFDEEKQKKFNELLQGENFSKLYAFAIESITPASKEQLIGTEGKWIKYDRNSDHMPLVHSLQGHGTGWCTAGESTAETQLKGGDFYVYYSYDEDGKPIIPRAAIRMQQGKIAEVRGIAEQQNLDSNIAPVVEEKLQEFPDGEQYKKKTSDMKRLTEIERKTLRQDSGRAGEELSKDDIKFLYEIDSKIEGFGHQRDSRIKEIQNQRDVKEDLSFAFDVPKDKVSITKEEALQGGILFHLGHLDLKDVTSTKGLELPEYIGGNLYLNNLTSFEGLKLPNRVGGNLDFFRLTSVEGLKLPGYVGGHLVLNRLTSIKGLNLPEYIGDGLNLERLTSAKDLNFPEHMDGGLNLDGLISSEGLKLPENVSGNLHLSGLTSSEGLKLPKRVDGNVHLSGLILSERDDLRTKYPNLSIGD
ncbi:hypothetical protein CL630_03725 [bacterium]|nr:hypothetical protein [bacterium]|tara:strand:+ start:2246 stop:4093 length:1848 start_codon:yes stop_codon:yes gene_type:complete